MKFKTSPGKSALGRLSLISTVLLRPFQTNGNVQHTGWKQISVKRKLVENSCNSIFQRLIERKFQEPLASSRLCRLGLDPNKLKAIYTLPLRLTKDTKLCMFQYKIIQNILTNL